MARSWKYVTSEFGRLNPQRAASADHNLDTKKNWVELPVQSPTLPHCAWAQSSPTCQISLWCLIRIPCTEAQVLLSINQYQQYTSVPPAQNVLWFLSRSKMETWTDSRGNKVCYCITHIRYVDCLILASCSNFQTNNNLSLRFIQWLNDHRQIASPCWSILKRLIQVYTNVELRKMRKSWKIYFKLLDMR